jgi:DNA helicase HerA-like ATPase
VILEVDRNHPQSLSKRISQNLISAEGTTWTSSQVQRTHNNRKQTDTVWDCQINFDAADTRNVFVVNLDNHIADMDGGPLSHSESANAVIKRVLQYKNRAGNEDKKICIVMEEAYDFIPESTFGQQDFGQPNVSRIAQLLLKCRKYNIGFLVITQRTALVSKTILYQCNTIIALQTFDETSKTFMSAYINQKYLNSMSILPRFRAIVVGKGSSCDKPVIVDFFDHAHL